ncbi:hypothetical protein MY4824_008765 [Beauveria thailandica]
MNGTSSSDTIYCTVKILENEDRRKPAHEKRSAKRKAETTAAAWPVPSARRLKASRSRLIWARVLYVLVGEKTDRGRFSFPPARQPITQWHINPLAEYVVQNLYRYVDALRSSVGARWLMGKQRTPHAYAKAAERSNKKRQATKEYDRSSTNKAILTPTPDEAVVSGPLALAVHWHNRYLGPEPGLFRGVGAAGFVKVAEYIVRLGSFLAETKGRFIKLNLVPQVPSLEAKVVGKGDRWNGKRIVRNDCFGKHP